MKPLHNQRGRNGARIAIFILCYFVAYGIKAETIFTVAGNGQPAFSGDQEEAIQASLFSPSDIFVDKDGNIYIVDSFNHCIRKVNTSGIITTIAGTGEPGFSGDGELATTAKLRAPRSICVDGKGNIYIADTTNQRIRKILADSKKIITIAGDGYAEDQGFAVIGRFAGDGGAALDASLNRPTGIFIDTIGNMYIADTGNHRVRKVNASSGIITTIAGNGMIGFEGDNGPATEARLWNPLDIFVTESGDIYIADAYNHRIRKIDTKGTITTSVGTGNSGLLSGGFFGDGDSGSQALLHKPAGIFIDKQNTMFISDSRNHRIRKVDTTGVISTVVGSGGTNFAGGDFSGDGGPATEARLKDPSGIFISSSGDLYIADELNQRIRIVKEIAAPSPLIVGVFEIEEVSASPDFDGNGRVDFADFLLFAQAFGSTNLRFDLNRDGIVGFADFLIFAEAFGKSAPKK